MDWSIYEPAIRRWEHRLGRLTPHPTQPGRHGRPVLSPRFVEHLMGLPTGWISDLPLPRTAQLRALGNGVVPQQAAHALDLLLADLHQLAPEALTPPWLAPCARRVASPSDQTSTATGTRRAA